MVEQDQKELFEYEQALREKYNPDNIFKGKEEIIMPNSNESTKEEIAIIEQKESIFAKIKNWIKGLFRRR